MRICRVCGDAEGKKCDGVIPFHRHSYPQCVVVAPGVKARAPGATNFFHHEEIHAIMEQTEPLFRKLHAAVSEWMSKKEGNIHADRDWRLKVVFDEVDSHWRAITGVKSPEQQMVDLHDRIAKLERDIAVLRQQRQDGSWVHNRLDPAASGPNTWQEALLAQGVSDPQEGGF